MLLINGTIVPVACSHYKLKYLRKLIQTGYDREMILDLINIRKILVTKLWNPHIINHVFSLKTCVCTWCSLCWLSWVSLGLTRIVTQYRTSTRGSGYWVMWWHCCCSWSFKPNHGNALTCSMLCVVYWFQSPCGKLRFVCTLDTRLNHFWVIDQLYLYYFSVTVMGLKCYLDRCDVFDLTIWGSWFNIILGYFQVICWEMKCIVIYLRCIWVAHWDPMHIMRCSLVARWEPMDFDIYQWCPQLLI